MQKILVKKAARRLLARARQQEGRLEGATSEPHQRAIMACLERLAACPPTPCLEGISEEILPDAPARQDCVEICAMTEFVPPCAPLPQSPEPSSTDVSLVHRMAGVGMRFQQMARPIVSPIYPACYGHPPQPPSECDSKSARSTEQANASRENAPLNIFSAERFSSSASSPPPTPAEWQLYGWTQRPYQK